MGKRKELTAEDHRNSALKELECWHNIYQNGCSDPFWPDGENLNLIRNHIIYANNMIDELQSQKEEQMSLFAPLAVDHVDVPEEVPMLYMAKERVCHYFDAPGHERPVYRQELENGRA